MSSQQLLQEPGAKGECGLANLLKTEAVGTGELGHSLQFHGHVRKGSGRQGAEDQDGEAMDEDDGTKRRNEGVNKKGEK